MMHSRDPSRPHSCSAADTLLQGTILLPPLDIPMQKLQLWAVLLLAGSTVEILGFILFPRSSASHWVQDGVSGEVYRGVHRGVHSGVHSGVHRRAHHWVQQISLSMFTVRSDGVYDDYDDYDDSDERDGIDERKPWNISSLSLDTASRKPIILLDVDGVINCVQGSSWPDQKKITVRGFGISYSPTIVESLNKFVREGLAEIRWLTAWGLHAPKNLAPAIGLDDFPTARDTKWIPRKDVVAKAIADACPERPIAWLDDELTYYAGKTVEFWRARPRTLLIEPKGHLTKKEMTRLETFLLKHNRNTRSERCQGWDWPRCVHELCRCIMCWR